MDKANKDAVIKVVCEVYWSGLLQYHPLVVCGITITMCMMTRANRLTASRGDYTFSINVYDADSQDAQESSIRHLIEEI